MNWKLLLYSFFLSVVVAAVFAAAPPATQAVDEFNQVGAGCDLCGWCGLNPAKKPATWERCMRCMYPLRSADSDISLTSPTTVYTGAKPNVNLDHPYYPTLPEYDPGDTTKPSKSWTVFGCMDSSPTGYVAQMYRIVLAIGSGLSFLALVYGSFLIITASGNPLQVKKGRGIMMGAGFGILLIIFSVFLLRLIGYEILKIPGFG